jgi:O-antigen/teichoic acid export membrane protein
MTETIRKVINNTFFVLSEKLLNRTLSFLLTIYLARFLGTADFGKLTFAMSFVSLFLVISDFGISMLSLRDISSNIKDGANYLGKISTLKAVLSLFTFFIIAS